jgi:predicted nucleic acid-binding protein
MLDGRLVLDTSVIIKWFRRREVLAEQAITLRDAYLAGQATVPFPSLLIYETANVLRYKSDYSLRQTQEAIESLFDMELTVVPLSVSVMQQALEMARTYDITIYDAAFATLAQTLTAAFVTADERLTKRLTALNFVHYLAELPV